METHDVPQQPARRNFIKKTCAVFVGAVTGLIPAISGLIVFLDPLRRKSQESDAVLVASLSSLPADGVPRKFSVIASHTDAWNRMPRVPVGAVYLRRIGDAIVCARRTFRVIRQNLAWALAYNLVAIPLAAIGHLTPLAAALGMSLSSLLVVANALRLLRGDAANTQRDNVTAPIVAAGH